MAASLVSMPIPLRSPASRRVSARGSATGSSFARRTSASSPPSRPAAGFGAVDGCLFDLGLSSFQLADRERGFGFRAGGPLDMRFDPSRGVPAAELLATLDADELTALFRRYGEEPKAPRIARAIVEARRVAPIATAEELAALVERVAARRTRASRAERIPRRGSSRRCGSPSTRSSRRSRPGSHAALDLLRPGGRLVVLSYHSLEDRIVKRFIQAERRGCVCPPEVPICVCGRNPRLRLITRPSLTPTADRDQRQPPGSERPIAGRRASRRLARRQRHRIRRRRSPR